MYIPISGFASQCFLPLGHEDICTKGPLGPAKQMRTVIHGAEFGPEHCYISCDDLPKDGFAAESSTVKFILKMPTKI